MYHNDPGGKKGWGQQKGATAVTQALTLYFCMENTAILNIPSAQMHLESLDHPIWCTT